MMNLHDDNDYINYCSIDMIEASNMPHDWDENDVKLEYSKDEYYQE